MNTEPETKITSYHKKLIKTAVTVRINQELTALSKGMGIDRATVEKIWKEQSKCSL